MKRISGMATLETGLFLAVMLGVIFSALGVIDYLRQVGEVRRITEQMVRATRVPPFQLRLDAQGVHADVPAAELDAAVSQMVSEATAQLQQRVAAVSGERFVVEGGYRILDIDPGTGMPRGLRGTPQGHAIAGGYQTRSDSSCAELEPLFVLRAGELRINRDAVGNRRSAFARSTADAQLLSAATVLIGLKIAVSLEDTPIARLLPRFTEAAECAVVAARFEGR